VHVAQAMSRVTIDPGAHCRAAIAGPPLIVEPGVDTVDIVKTDPVRRVADDVAAIAGRVWRVDAAEAVDGSMCGGKSAGLATLVCGMPDR
jgi:hypothetical protein